MKTFLNIAVVAVCVGFGAIGVSNLTNTVLEAQEITPTETLDTPPIQPPPGCPINCPTGEQCFGETVYEGALALTSRLGETTDELAQDISQKGMSLMQAGIKPKVLMPFQQQFNQAGQFSGLGKQFLGKARSYVKIAQSDDDYLDATKDVLRARRAFTQCLVHLKELDAALDDVANDLDLDLKEDTK